MDERDRANACPGCSARWAGLKAEHCPMCHETFSCTEIGDRHRVGEHGVSDGPTRRRCLSGAEMTELSKRFQVRRNAFGTRVWGYPGEMPAEVLAQRS